MIDLKTLKSLTGLLPAAASTYGDRPALKMAGAETSLSYRELESCSAAIASNLLAAGAQSGDRVILFCESRPEWMAAMFGIWGLGITVVPLPFDTVPENLAAVFHFTGAAFVVTSGRGRNILPEGLPVLLVEELTKGDSSVFPEADADIALLGFTSGSTARPRAVELSAANLLANLKGLLALRSTAPESNFLSLLPPAHLFELVVGQLGPLACGATIVYSETLLPNRVIETLKREHISGAIVVPGLLRMVFMDLVSELIHDGLLPSEFLDRSTSETAEWLENKCDAATLSQLRQRARERIGGELEMLVVGGAACDPHWAALARALNIRMEFGYGLTEASPVVSLEDTACCPAGSVGKALPGVDIRISEQGEILVRGANVMGGYFKDPEQTRQTLVDGWLHTGDKGEIDGDGWLFVRGRLKEAMVTEAGDTIYPEDVEPYYGCPLFREFCVVPFADGHGNDHPVLCVVAESEQTEPDELVATFNRLRARAPSRFRVDRMLRLDHSLPRTASGKIQRRALAQTLQTREVAK